MKKNKSRYIANVSLGVMAAGFAATLPFHALPVRILQGGFEAGLVGGLADWFAVTALFRHPLNIPIPHTALLPKNRKKITESILNVVEKDWLNKESITKKIQKVPFSSLLFNKMEDYLHTEEAAAQISSAIRTVYSYIDKEKIKSWMKKAAAKEIKQADKPKMIGFLAEEAIKQKYHEKGFDILLNLAEKKLTSRETKEKITDYILKMIEKKAENSFFKFALTPLLMAGKEKIQTAFDKALDDLLTDLKLPYSENRQNILSYIENEIGAAKTNSLLLLKAEQKTEEFLEGDSYDQVISSTADLLFSRIEKVIHDPHFAKASVIPKLQELTAKIQGDQNAVQQLEKASQTVIVQIIDQNHAKIGGLVKENLDKLNTEELVDLMENKIGKELSWIRVNGSICGFIIGILLIFIKLSTGSL
ncbi:DUF445 domain-containing protein [Metabacillus sp. GX 13764]|uniref:DUF445 domain-containing protein n=1 Tax=Metabacillus kandeliae TaxID=2900151 RepID=UPI001E54DB45|nr:DUF445 domain-containing protein [Metabacillus kandeliae]MCD7035484.1 DUF445 domain-containing protein [Metabacillus kandeliae]